MSKVNVAVNAEKADIKAKVNQAITDLTLIIANADVLTIVQVRQAIKKLAINQRAMIKRIAQLR